MRQLKELIFYARVFYRFAGWRVPMLVALALIGGLLDVIGIVSLLPLLQVAMGEADTNALTRAALDVMTTLGLPSDFKSMALIIVTIFLAKGSFVFAHSFWTIHTITTVRKNVQTALAKRIGDANFTFYTEQNTGHMINVLTNETKRFSSGLKVFGQVLVGLIYIAIYVPTILTLQFNLALTLVVATLVVFVAVRPLIERTRQLSISASRQNSALAAELIQFVHAIPYLKATATLPNLRRHVRGRVKEVASLDLRMGLRTAILGGFKEPVAVAVLILYILIEVEIGGGSLASVAVVGLLLYRLLNQTLGLPASFQRINQLTGSINFVVDFTRNVTEAAEHDGPNIIETIDSDIVFSNVRFDRGERNILRDINLRIPRHQTIGIVGESGAGKTTFFNLLTGLLEPSDGAITVADHDYRTLKRSSLRKLIGYVPQDPVIINDTIANNICLYACDPENPDCRAKIVAAAAAANCETFLESTPDGLDTMVGDRGMRLSGGQRQRIAIARELFKDPELLIFDEATSSLDGQSEAYVQDSIDKLHGQRTIVIIAHRLSTMRRCDWLYVFENGTVIEQGGFNELYAQSNSAFRRMCEQQGVRPLEVA
ncbi:MAG: ABC transporter ATP-binding protein [Rhodospirillaceae bacterium]|jgi:ABC-type multidrug transport system fused ATPase/permease subunit|nr:ABC transporter ATP-binding protein [Rhodospirillaceae bacterium]